MLVSVRSPEKVTVYINMSIKHPFSLEALIFAFKYKYCKNYLCDQEKERKLCNSPNILTAQYKGVHRDKRDPKVTLQATN